MARRRQPQPRTRSTLAEDWKMQASSGPARCERRCRDIRASPRPCPAEMQTRKAASAFARQRSSSIRTRPKSGSKGRAGTPVRAGSQTPGELPLRRKTRALVPDDLGAPLDRNSTLGRSVDDERRARLRGDVAQLDTVCVELECAL